MVVVSCVVLFLALQLLGSLGGAQGRVWGVRQKVHAPPAEDAGLGDACATEEKTGERDAEAADHTDTAHSIDAHDAQGAVESGDTHVAGDLVGTPYLQSIVLGDEQLLRAIADNDMLVEECMTDGVMLEIMRCEDVSERVLRIAVLRRHVSRWAADYLIALENVRCAEDGNPSFWHAVCEQDLERLLCACTPARLAELAESAASEVFVGDGFPSMLRTERGRELLERAASGGGSRLGAAVARLARTCSGDTLAELVAVLSGSDTAAVEFSDGSGQVLETRRYSMRSTVFRTSEHIRARMREYVEERLVQGAETHVLLISLACAPSVFDTVADFADNRPPDVASALRLSCLLGIPCACETAALYRRLASAAQHPRGPGGRTRRGSVRKARAHMLSLLREYAGAYGVLVGVDGNRAALYPESEDMYNNYASRNRACAVGEVSIMDAAMDRIAQGDRDAPDMLAWFMRGMGVHTLDVRWCRLDTAMVRSIGSIESLAVLTMLGCSMHPGSIVHLRDLPNLEQLDVSRVLLSSQDVADIAKMQRLVSLRAMSCGLVPGSLVHLGGLRRLETLDISNVVVDRLRNSFGGDDMAAAGQMACLKSLHLRMCDLEPECLWHLRASATLSALDVCRARLSVHCMSGVACLAGLRSLRMRGCEFEAGCLEHLAGMALLRELDVSWSVLSESSMREIASARGLTKLVMDRCRIEPGGLEHIADMEALEELRVVDIAGINSRDRKTMRSLQARGVAVYT